MKKNRTFVRAVSKVLIGTVACLSGTAAMAQTAPDGTTHPGDSTPADSAAKSDELQQVIASNK